MFERLLRNGATLWLTALAVVVLGALWQVSGAAAPGPPPPPKDADYGPLPEGVAHVLELKAQAYAARALRFTCREVRRRAKYSGNEATSESGDVFDYLLARADEDPTRLIALRAAPGDPGSKRVVDAGSPEPFEWTQLFAAGPRSVVRWHIAGRAERDGRRRILVDWLGMGPVLQRDRLPEWTGRIEIEDVTGNLLELTAKPNRQDAMIEAKRLEWQQAFNFLGLHLDRKNRPIGWELAVSFYEDHEGFTYPSRVELLKFMQYGPDRDDRRLMTRETSEFQAYRFFGTATKEEIPPLRVP